MRISDWSSDVCSSDLELIRTTVERHSGISVFAGIGERSREGHELLLELRQSGVLPRTALVFGQMNEPPGARWRAGLTALAIAEHFRDDAHENVLLLIDRSEEHTSELQSLMRSSYAVFCLKKKKNT